MATKQAMEQELRRVMMKHHIKKLKTKKNPSSKRVLIYSDVIRIIARKGQIHVCDAECKRKNHTYFHDFKPGSKIYGLPDKSLLIKGQEDI